MAQAQPITATELHADTVITLPAVDDVVLEISDLTAGFDAAPASPVVLKVESPSGTVIFQIPITSAGPAPIPFRNGLKGPRGQGMVVTLPDGGSGVNGYLNVIPV